ncbi:beta-phosphoglucomutase family hydrolase [Histophilus somni]|uniref:beta-phosphoglucomutase family hydrolase n=1 Tax=Histophilus somni TaxID=731 RepID=UPI00109C0C9E|nr:beta-phosphoglucomutase family hydrolase [Histophilus somni]MBB5150853.1 beta-phosphoglucomutase family hydrolase [Histophilus somni]QEH22230.1 beta-phosphoglucomutase family hydrolase [Histophilus somni]THA45456.1 beta-phosphoglucomutase family hydrolase [Histophilus somni]
MLNKEIIARYEGLIFDMDGTVIDTMPCHKQAWELVGAEMGYALDGDVMYQLGGAPVRTIAKAIMEKAQMPLYLMEDVISLKRKYGIELIMKNATLLPAADIVKQYVGQKPLALGTGSHRYVTEMLLEKFQLQSYFGAIVTAEDVINHKPEPDTFLRCAELLNLDPLKCLVFEDTDLGVQAGLAAEMDVFDVRVNQIITSK